LFLEESGVTPAGDGGFNYHPNGPNSNSHSNPHPNPLSPALDRIPPQSLDSEQSVLGSMLICPGREATLLAREVLVPADFYRDSHRRIYEAVCRLDDADEPTDILTVANELERVGYLDLAGGRAYLMACVSTVPTYVRVAAYARRVKDAALLRRVIDIGGQLIGLAYEQDLPVEQVIERAQRWVFELGLSLKHGDPLPLKTVLAELGRHLEELQAQAGPTLGVTTGFPRADRLLGRLRAGRFTIIAGRPSVGKTALMLSMLKASAKEGTASLVWSIEMSREDLGVRLLSDEVSIDSLKFGTGKFDFSPETGDEWQRVGQGIAQLSPLPIWVDDNPSRTLAEMRSSALKLAAAVPLKLLALDYVQLMARRTCRPEELRLEIGHIAAGLRAIGKEIGAHVLLLSQVNRDADRHGGEPRLSMLSESGLLEQDADTVLFPYRPRMRQSLVLGAGPAGGQAGKWGGSKFSQTFGAGGAGGDDLTGPNGYEATEDAFLLVAKNRYGPTGRIPVRFVRRFARYTPVEDDGTDPLDTQEAPAVVPSPPAPPAAKPSASPEPQESGIPPDGNCVAKGPLPWWEG